MLGQVNKCVVSCMFCEHRGQVGVVCVLGDILCKYDCRIGDLLVRNCAMILLVLCGSVCSVGFMGGGCLLITLLCVV